MTENKKSRMYAVGGERVRTWNPFLGCLHECIYCYAHEQAKRRKNKCEKCYNFEPHAHVNRLKQKFKAGETVFVCSMGDISFASFDQFADILEVIGNYPKTTFYIQSKNPAYFAEYLNTYSSFIGYNPVLGRTNVVLGTTIETNKDTKYISKAPLPQRRISHLAITALAMPYHPRYFLTAEPLLDFDLGVLVKWVKVVAPEFVYVGYLNPLWKAKKLQLPEPPLAKVKELCWELGKFTEVRLKTIRKGWDEE